MATEREAERNQDKSIRVPIWAAVAISAMIVFGFISSAYRIQRLHQLEAVADAQAKAFDEIKNEKSAPMTWGTEMVSTPEGLVSLEWVMARAYVDYDPIADMALPWADKPSDRRTFYAGYRAGLYAKEQTNDK